jgi:hypothetical protein
MDWSKIKQSFHQLIEEIHDEELLSQYYELLKSEMKSASIESSKDALVARAEKSLKSVQEGKTRSLDEFKLEVLKYKQTRLLR